MAHYTRIEEVADYIRDKLDVAKASLGIEYVGYGDEQALPKYPAIVILPGLTQREFRATRQFENTFNIEIYIYHARLLVGRSTRTKEDLELVRRVTDLLHSDKTLGGQIIFGYIDSENPGVLASTKGDAIVGTRITWRGMAIENFSMP